jgi:urocanate hydratase
MNGGFGMVIDGSEDSKTKLQSMLHWDVNNGVARRAWARNSGAVSSIKEAMKTNASLKVTLPNSVDKNLLQDIFKGE